MRPFASVASIRGVGNCSGRRGRGLRHACSRHGFVGVDRLRAPPSPGFAPWAPAAASAPAPSSGCAGHGVDDDARRWLQLICGERLHRRRRDRAVARDVLLQIVRRAEVVVVGVQAIGDAAEAAKALQPADDVRLDGVARALDLGGVGRRRAERCPAPRRAPSRAPRRCGPDAR